MSVITTVPNVSYIVHDKKGGSKEVHNPSGLSDPATIDMIEEPFIRSSIITTTEYIRADHDPLSRQAWCTREARLPLWQSHRADI